jgi:hypothetical protein
MRWHWRTGLGVVVLANSTYAPAYQAASHALTLLLEHAEEQNQPRSLRGHRTGTVAPPRLNQQQPPPSGIIVWPQTLQAKAQIDRLLRGWDDDLAEQVFADSVAQDEPWQRRRARIEQIVRDLGSLTPDNSIPLQHQSPAHCRWWLTAPHGRVRAEILLTPQNPSQVQSLTLAPVPDPSPQLRSVINAVAAALRVSEPSWPSDLATTMDLDRSALTRHLQLAAGWAGRCVLGDVTAGNGTTLSSFQLLGEYATLSAEVRLDSETGAVRAFNIRNST